MERICKCTPLHHVERHHHAVIRLVLLVWLSAWSPATLWHCCKGPRRPGSTERPCGNGHLRRTDGQNLVLVNLGCRAKQAALRDGLHLAPLGVGGVIHQVQTAKAVHRRLDNISCRHSPRRQRSSPCHCTTPQCSQRSSMASADVFG